MKKTMMFTALALSVATVFAQTSMPALAAKPATAATPAEADPVVITAGSMQIHQSEFEQAVKALPQEYQQIAGGPGRKQFAEDYLRMKMLSAEGVKNGLDKSPELIAQLTLMRENLIANAQLRQIENAVQVTDADLRKAYDANVKDYEQVKAQHILVAFAGSPASHKQEGKTELTEAQAKAKADELRAKIVGGADFAEVAKKESDDTGSGSNGGDLGTFGHGQMVPEFEQAAFAAKVGEVTPVVRTQFGYHIIKVEAKTTTPFDQVKGTLEKDTKQKKVQEAIDAMKGPNVKYSDTYFAPPAPPAPAADAAPAGEKAGKPAASSSKSTVKPAAKPVKKP
ncbi:MAG: peptidylprolyl isomerase [Acidobacteriota bacterium]